MWYFKVGLWIWHMVSITGLFFDKGKQIETVGWMILLVLTLGFLGIIRAIEGDKGGRKQESEVGVSEA